MNEFLKDYLNAVENDIDALTDPSKFSSREDMGEMFHDFLGYDPTRYWDQQIMMEQMTKLTETDDVVLSLDEREDAVEAALDHFDAIKPNIMLQVAQKTIKSMFDKEVTSEDLNLDIEFLMNNEVFGVGYDESDDDDDEDENSLLDELNDDDELDDEDEEDLVD